MEQVDFGQSLKNIPFGGKKEYVKQMTHSIRKTVFSMRWAAAFYLGIIKESDEVKETYGFNSQKKVPYVEELKDFCSEVTHLIDGVRWRKNVSNSVQQKLRDTIRDLAGNSDTPMMYAKADKSDKFYKRRGAANCARRQRAQRIHPARFWLYQGTPGEMET